MYQTRGRVFLHYLWSLQSWERKKMLRTRNKWRWMYKKTSTRIQNLLSSEPFKASTLKAFILSMSNWNQGLSKFQYSQASHLLQLTPFKFWETWMNISKLAKRLKSSEKENNTLCIHQNKCLIKVSESVELSKFKETTSVSKFQRTSSETAI